MASYFRRILDNVTRRAKPIRIIGSPDNQRPDYWSSAILCIGRLIVFSGEIKKYVCLSKLPCKDLPRRWGREPCPMCTAGRASSQMGLNVSILT